MDWELGVSDTVEGLRAESRMKNGWLQYSLLFFFFNDTATTEIYTLSLHHALPIYLYHVLRPPCKNLSWPERQKCCPPRSEEHTSELQSHSELVCSLLLETIKE